jgi:hypothetical protein
MRFIAKLIETCGASLIQLSGSNIEQTANTSIKMLAIMG